MTKKQEKSLRIMLEHEGFYADEIDDLIQSQKGINLICSTIAIIGCLIMFGVLAYVIYQLLFIG
jgi:hypothetical protein